MNDTEDIFIDMSWEK